MNAERSTGIPLAAVGLILSGYLCEENATLRNAAVVPRHGNSAVPIIFARSESIDNYSPPPHGDHPLFSNPRPIRTFSSEKSGSRIACFGRPVVVPVCPCHPKPRRPTTLHFTKISDVRWPLRSFRPLDALRTSNDTVDRERCFTV